MQFKGGFLAGKLYVLSQITHNKSFNHYPQLKVTHLSLVSYLDEMSLGLSRLKTLGLGLQTEIEDQDASLDSLLNKVDKMDLKIDNTNQQMKKLK